MAGRLGAAEKFNFKSSEEIFNEFAAVTAGARADYSGMSYSKLERNKGLFWPCKSANDPGQARLFERGFAHPDGLAKMRPIAWQESSEEPDAAYPFRLTTGRVLEHYLSGNQTRRIPQLRKAQPEPFLQIGSATAESLGLEDGAKAKLSTRRGTMTLPVKINAGQEEGTLFVPMHFGGEGCANRLTQDALSPLSKMPEFKNCAAKLEVP
jgi:assimilatory nitrate reductase catalytic subunit